MKILVTGAYGFIGSHIVAGLVAAGHEVIGCGRDIALGRRLIPHIDWIECDLNRDTDPADWIDRLDGIDAAINCAGILQSSATDDIDAIHRQGPVALFEACRAAGVGRVIQISALGIEPEAGTNKKPEAGTNKKPEAGTGYADSKRGADEALMAMDMDWVVLRPSLVYARNCYGGTALFRGLAALPFAIPAPGGGNQRFQPIHMGDLVRAVLRLVKPDAPSRVLLEPVGPAPMALRDILSGLRQWLGLGPAPVVGVPMGIVRLAAKLGDLMHWIGMRGSMRSTALNQMSRDNVADMAPFAEAVGFTPRRFTDALSAEPAGPQDRWHARLVFLRPLLRIVLGLFWLASGLITAFDPARSDAMLILDLAGFDGGWAMAALWCGVATDIALGGLVLIDRHVRLAGIGMIAVTAGYLAVLSLTIPELWLDPLGPLVKTLPLIPAILVMMALEDDR
jgi:uncharacterized protein YbjT (DUF2867 family)